VNTQSSILIYSSGHTYICNKTSVAVQLCEIRLTMMRTHMLYDSNSTLLWKNNKDVYVRLV